MSVRGEGVSVLTLGGKGGIESNSGTGFQLLHTHTHTHTHTMKKLLSSSIYTHTTLLSHSSTAGTSAVPIHTHKHTYSTHKGYRAYKTIYCTRKWIGNAVQNISSSSVWSRDKIARVRPPPARDLATATVFSLPKLTNRRYSSPPCCWW